MAEESHHRISVCYQTIINNNLGKQGDVITGVQGDVITDTIGDVLKNVARDVVLKNVARDVVLKNVARDVVQDGIKQRQKEPQLRTLTKFCQDEQVQGTFWDTVWKMTLSF